MFLTRVFGVMSGIALGALATYAAASDGEGLEFFEKKIRPVLATRCYECHAADSKEAKGGLLLDTREGIRRGGDSGPAVVPGDVDDSTLIQAIRHETFEMPPKEKLPDSVIADFVAWIKMGAPDPRDGAANLIKREINFKESRGFWAFQPPQQIAPPAVKNDRWPRADIDRFVLAKLEAVGLSPAVDADRVKLARRLYFDLIGLPPTPDQLQTFVNDQSTEAVSRLVDQLLDSPQFGERWGRHWLDVVRYAESNGRERNFLYPNAWRYRDYVIASFNADKPYDQFIREQIAGDLIAKDEPGRRNELLVATGFLALGPKLLNERDAEIFRMDMVDEQLDVSTRAVMALTVSCARCHDHKFDPIPTREYYSLAGIFRSTETLFGTNGNGNRQPSKLISLPVETPQGDEAAKRREQTIAKLESELTEAQAELKRLQNGTKKSKASKQVLAEQRKQVSQLTNALAAAKEGKSSGQFAMGVTEGKVEDSPLYVRGETDDPDGRVPRGWLTILSQGEALRVTGQDSGRLELADWLTSKDNPLTARVLVNRVWQHLFGQGLCQSVDNFGATGQTPSHPELLDYLAEKFMDDGWSVKRLIREIVLTRTYQLDSAFDEHAFTVDPENSLLWRHSPRRLDAEALRDAALAASGQLDLTPREGSVVAKYDDSQQIGRGLTESAFDTANNHRSVYLPIVRNAVPEALNVFDFAEPSIIVAQRQVTTVPAQALYMMNSPFIIEQADKLAELLTNTSQDPVQRVEIAYTRALQRPPTTDEVERATQFVEHTAAMLDGKDAVADQRIAWSSFCQALFASAEFRYVE